MCTLNQKVVLNSLLQLVAVRMKQMLKHPRGLMLFVRVTRNGDQKVQSERYQMRPCTVPT